MDSRIEIPLSKKKIILLLFAANAFVLGGIWLAINPEKFIPNIFRITDPKIIQFTGLIGILFFAVGGIFGVRKLFDKKAGLVIDANGITDNSNALSTGLIEWGDINGIRTKEIMSTKFLLIDIADPEKYIRKAKNRFQAKLMRANMVTYKTPLSITSNTLKYNFKDLEKLIRTEYERNKNSR